MTFCHRVYFASFSYCSSRRSEMAQVGLPATMTSRWTAPSPLPAGRLDRSRVECRQRAFRRPAGVRIAHVTCFGGPATPHLVAMTPVQVIRPTWSASVSEKSPRRARVATRAFIGQSMLGLVMSEPVIAGATVASAALASTLFWFFSGRRGDNDGGDSRSLSDAKHHSNAARRTDAVLVFGATGKLGKQVVASCVAAGRHVVATGRRDETALGELFKGMGIKAGKKQKASANSSPINPCQGYVANILLSE